MKKLLLLLALLMPVCFSSCGSDEKDEPAKESVMLDKDNVSIKVGDEVNIQISGCNPEDCTVYTDDEFVVDPIIYRQKLNVSGLHVGTTSVYVKHHNGNIGRCVVNVEAKTFYLGNPVLDFGLSRDEVLSKMNGTVHLEYESGNFEEEERASGIIFYHNYCFNSSNGKLESVSTSTYSEKYPEALVSLTERYRSMNPQPNKSRVWLEYPGKMVVNLRKKGGNGGYQVCYAPTLDIMDLYWQID